MLVAPAGYGKTTLAEQWVARDGRRGAWFRARPASVDVAALALGIAKASLAIVQDCDTRLRAHLKAVPAAPDRVATLAEILGEDLETWPTSAWLVIDEYEAIAGAAEAEELVGSLVVVSQIRLVITSRQRPSWVDSRDILYGSVLELEQGDLAMDSHEAEDVLAERSPSSASGLAKLAHGWPAVIGLASVLPPEIEGSEPVPEALYRFFAEEVFTALGEEVAAGLAVLAEAPVLDRDLAVVLLGEEAADHVCTTAIEMGVLVEREENLDLHPLARAFLEDRRAVGGDMPGADVAERCIDHYRRARDWDAAFDVISRRGVHHALAGLLESALDDLLETARLSTIETWCALAGDWGIDDALFDLARAEVALRHGRHTEAQVLAQSAAARGSILAFRALAIAGLAAHLASREEDALELYRRAEAAGRNDAERRDALWGQLLCAIELELPEATQSIEDLVASASTADPREVVRSAGCRLNYQLHFGALDLADADGAAELLDSLNDPIAVASFQCLYAAALSLSARYPEARDVSNGRCRLFVAIALHSQLRGFCGPMQRRPPDLGHGSALSMR